MAFFDFDLNSVSEDTNSGGSYELLPQGEYIMQCNACEERLTKAGTGSYLNAEFEIVDGEYAGRRVWQNFNVNNPNEKAQSIGRAELKRWANAAGKPAATDSDELIGEMFRGVVGVQKGNNGYADSNIIKKFSPMSGQAAPAPVAQQPTPPPATQGTAGGTGGNPWDAPYGKYTIC